ncbi:MarR family transcriptional regulator [Pedobacter yulinensis]|uniref:MarR family transcriptional regulator n=1 Tax=Pedobacter yulinensis TaxID=2126353 RepID=A0A2T3HHZ0_9SPHI|nr:MarR family transcriptional regulator [Pedobacter yulinensis]PST82052.1 MarR family transcriptional regulator [Pedobacter yulinensis]
MNAQQVKEIRKLSQLYAYRSLQMHEATARRAGLPGTDHKYLGFILEKGQMTAGELARLTGLSTGAITGLVDRFEKQGFVSRQAAENDRRKVIIVAHAEKIMEVFEPLYRDFRANLETLASTFSAEEAKTIEKFLSASVDIMTEAMNKLNNS